jgi:hypothetical protein
VETIAPGSCVVLLRASLALEKVSGGQAAPWSQPRRSDGVAKKAAIGEEKWKISIQFFMKKQ